MRNSVRCLDWDQVCDGSVDCDFDGSDESSCQDDYRPPSETTDCAGCAEVQVIERLRNFSLGY